MNFLSLCQNTLQWSGKGAGASLTSVLNQAGQLLDVVNAVIHAYNLIQQKHDNWQWMRAEFSATLAAIAANGVATTTQARYNPVSAFQLTRFSNWVYDQIAQPGGSRGTYRPMTIYKQSTGVSDTQEISYVVWEDWRRQFGRGLVTANRPTAWSADPSLAFCLGQPLDDIYILQGEYFKNEQILAVNADIPEMPTPFHMAIVWRAVLLLTEKDEAASDVYDRAENKYAEILTNLETNQLPILTIGGAPIA